MSNRLRILMALRGHAHIERGGPDFLDEQLSRARLGESTGSALVRRTNDPSTAWRCACLAPKILRRI